MACVQGVASLFCADSTMSSLQSPHNQCHGMVITEETVFGQQTIIQYTMAWHGSKQYSHKTIKMSKICDCVGCKVSFVFWSLLSQLIILFGRMLLLESQLIFICAWFAWFMFFSFCVLWSIQNCVSGECIFCYHKISMAVYLELSWPIQIRW